MKIIYVNTPHQNESTPNPQIIDGKIPQWCVETHRLKLGQTVTEFLEERWGNFINKHGEGIIEGFYIYDIIPITKVHMDEPMFMVRLDYIKK